MRSSAVNSCIELFDILNISTKSMKSIDVGGTEHVMYDNNRVVNPLNDTNNELTYLDKGFNIDILQTNATIRGDILDYETIQNLESKFDITYSFDTLQYTPDPMLFCKNLNYITKPNGYIFISTIFNWQYQPDPEDYFRFTPPGLIECYNKYNKQNTIIWCGWDSDTRGVILLAYKGIIELPLDTLYKLNTLKEIRYNNYLKHNNF